MKFKKLVKRCLALFLAAAVAGSSADISVYGKSRENDSAPNMQSVKSAVIDVTEFGADPSGYCDSTEAVRAALEKAKETEGNVTINFPKGEYHFWKDYASKRNFHTSNTSSLSYPEKSIAILLEETDNVTFEGNGSLLVMHGDMMAVAAVKSKNVLFHNFSLDYKDADTVDISVVENGTDENGKEYTDFFVPANYNYKIADNGKAVTWQGDKSPVTGKPYWEKESADSGSFTRGTRYCFIPGYTLSRRMGKTRISRLS